MNKKRIKTLAVPAIYTLAIITFSTSMYLIEKLVNNNKFMESSEDIEYVSKEIVTDNEYIPVINQVNTIMKPYLNEEVTISKKFYNYESDATSQEQSLIYYENTYIQNSGIDYTNKEIFDVISVLDGTVIDISDNDILGHTIKIRHNNDLITTYQSLSEINVKKDDNILRGQVIGKSGNCKLYSENSNLHFEIYYQGKNVDPETYIGKNQDELQ